MAEVIWTKSALNNLDEIADYIALDKPSAAYNFVTKILKKVDNLEQFPDLGRKPPEFIKTKFRELVISPCRVFYFFEGDKIYIVHVMRSEQQLRRYMLEDYSVHEESAIYQK